MSRRLVNLCFHGIGAPARDLEPGEDAYWIAPDLYEDLLDEVAGREDVRISFDDGNASDVVHGLPGLVSRGLTATFFVLAGRLGQPGSLDEDEIRTLRAAGMEIGTHGMDHRSWRGMDPDTERRELVEARDRIGEVAGVPVTEAALPLGRYDRRTLAALRRAGYQRVHTSDRRPGVQGHWLQPRWSVRCDDTLACLRAEVLAPRPATEVAARAAIGLVKRLR